MIDWSTVEHFRPSEFSAPDKMHPRVLKLLDKTRETAGVVIHVTSSYRGGDEKSHGRGWAVDISDNRWGKEVSSVWRAKVLPALWEHGCRRIGVYDKHLHADCDPILPPDVIWWGTSS